HSLLATQVTARVRAVFGVELPVRAVFESPVLAELAAIVARAAAEQDGEAVPAPLLSGERPERLPLSFAQRRLWFLDQLEPGSSAYNVPLAVRVRGDLRPDLLAAVLAEIVRRHEALRTVFASEGGEPSQVILPGTPGAPLSLI